MLGKKRGRRVPEPEMDAAQAFGVTLRQKSALHQQIANVVHRRPTRQLVEPLVRDWQPSGDRLPQDRSAATVPELAECLHRGAAGQERLL